MADFYSGWLGPPNGFAKYRLHLIVNVAAQDTAANTTTLSWATILEKDRSQNGFFSYNATWSATVNGAVVVSSSGLVPSRAWTGWSSWTLASGSTVVAHDADGSKASMAVASVYNGANTGWAIGSVSLSGTMALPTIGRATIPTVSPSPAAIGTTVTIDLPRANASYTHDVTWVSNTLSGTVALGVGASTTFVTPNVLSQYPGKPLAPIVITVVTKLAAAVIGSRQVTLFAKAVPVPPAPPAPPSIGDLASARQFDVRARLVEYIGAEWVATKVIPANTIQLVDPASATATCSISLSGLNMVGFLDDSVIDIDVFDGVNWIFTNHRFALSRSDGDEVDPTEMHTYSGSEFIDYSLRFAHLPRELNWDGAAGHVAPTTPGEIMREAIDAAKSRGWGPRVERDFTALRTGLDETWANPTIARVFSAGTPISQMLDGLVTDGLCEYRTEYRSNKGWLILLNPGTGSDFSADGASPVVNFSTALLSRAPRRSTSEKRLTRVTVAGDEDIQISREKTPFNANVFGHMEGWVAASGVKDTGAAGTIGDNALRDNQSLVNERTFEYEAQYASSALYPYSVFRPGDWVLIPDGENTLKDRVSQVTVDKKADGTITLTVLTGDRILSGTASLAKRQAAQSGGSIAGGSQSSQPPLDSRIPAAPVIASVTSLGYWNTDGAAKSTITITWAAVTQALNGAAIQCDVYEAWWRPAGTAVEWSYVSSTRETSIALPGWDVAKAIDLRVRARSVPGIHGEFSEDQLHTTLAPVPDLSGPVMTDLYTDGVGNIFAVWAGILGTSAAPKYLAYVAAEVSGNLGATWETKGTPISAPGSIVLNPGAYGDYSVRLRGYDRLGNPGTASLAQDIALVDPRINPATPAAPTALTATSGAAWDASGLRDSAWFDLAWTAPTLDTQGVAVTIAGYDVWGKTDTETVLRFLTSSKVAAVRIMVEAKQNWSFQVAAVTASGGLSALSAPVIASATAVIAAPAAPTAPVLSQYAGLLRVQWAGGGMVPQVKYVYASISTTLGGTYTRAGMPLLGAGEVVIPGLAVGPYYAKINLVDEREQVVSSVASGLITLLPITGVTVQTSAVANTGIKMTSSSLTSYNAAGNPTFILNAATGEVWIAPYDAVFDLGAVGNAATTGLATTGIAISSANSSFNTFIHASGVQIRNDQTALSWWEADASDASLVNFFSPRAVFGQRMLLGDFEFQKELKPTGSRLVIRYKGA